MPINLLEGDLVLLVIVDQIEVKGISSTYGIVNDETNFILNLASIVNIIN